MDDKLNYKISRLYELCMRVWPHEFQVAYAGRREDFNEWLNDKTGLHEDPSRNKSKAVLSWLDAMELIAQNKG